MRAHNPTTCLEDGETESLQAVPVTAVPSNLRYYYCCCCYFQYGIEESAPDQGAVIGRTKAIPLVNKCLLNSYYVPDTVLGIGEIMQNKRVKKLCV